MKDKSKISIVDLLENPSQFLKIIPRITEWFGLEGTFQGHLVQPPAMSRDIYHQTRLLRAPSNLTLNVSRDRASTTSLGNCTRVSPPSL